ncbi:hypothetical protein EGM70_08255 [Enterobacteriaceae bacterium 89]|nr:hypothetical protein [Enterobacteriaceae bacterium 89]
MRSWIIPYALPVFMAVTIYSLSLVSVITLFGKEAFSSPAYDPQKNCLYNGKVYPAGAKINGPGHFPLTCRQNRKARQQDGMLSWEQ